MKKQLTTTAPLLLAFLLSSPVGAATLVDYTFDGVANDTGSFQVLTNGQNGSPANTDLNTGLLDADGVSAAVGFNTGSALDLTTEAPSATGFELTFDITGTDATVSGLDANGLFFGVTSGSSNTGTAGSSLWNNNPHAFGYAARADNQGATNAMVQHDQSGSNFDVTALGTTTPTDASYQNGFTLTLGLFDDDTWTITSTGLSTDLNGSGSLNTSTTDYFSYSEIAADVVPYVSLQGEKKTLTVDQITLTTVPEPMSAIPFGICALTLALVRRRRRG